MKRLGAIAFGLDQPLHLFPNPLPTIFFVEHETTLPSPIKGVGKQASFKVPLPLWERDLG